MILNNLSRGGLLILGFLIMAATSAVLTFKQARAVDAMGDVSSLKAQIGELREESQQSGLDKETRENIQKEIKEIEEEKMPKQRQDVMNAMAALPNGAIIWTFLSQVGAAIFGLGVLSIFLKEDENHVVRATALLIIGGIILTFIAARFAYTIIGGGSGMGGMF